MQARGSRRIGPEQADEHGREGNDRISENQRHNAASRYLHGDDGGLTAVHLGAAHLLCILYRDLAFRQIDVHDRKEDEHGQYEEDADFKQHFADVRRRNADELLQDRHTRRGNDTDEDDQRNTVAHAVIRNAFAQPHNQHGAARIYDGHINTRNPNGSAEQLRSDCAFAVGEIHDNSHRLHDRENDRNNAGDVRDFFLALFALFGKALQRGNSHGQQLHDNRSVDVRSDTERKQRTVCKRAARNSAHERKEVVPRNRALELLSQKSRNGDIAPDTEHEQQQEGE